MCPANGDALFSFSRSSIQTKRCVLGWFIDEVRRSVEKLVPAKNAFYNELARTSEKFRSICVCVA